MFEKLVIASNNAGKLREIGQLLAPLGIEVLPQSAFNVPEAEEPYETFLENALAKARHAARLTGLAALADDSGICVDALGGAPGVQSARFAGEPKSDSRNNERLLRGERGDSATIRCSSTRSWGRVARNCPWNRKTASAIAARHWRRW
jgi:XTP/dITP diphosphohydrolase